MDNQEKIIKLINVIEELFCNTYIDDFAMTDYYDNDLVKFSHKLDEIFIDDLNNELLEMISKIDKKEIFYIEQTDEYKNNKIRKQIVEYLDTKPLYLDFDLVKKYISINYKLAKYVKDKQKLLELLDINEEVILIIDIKYLSNELVLERMKKSNLITKIFLGMYERDNNLYQISMFYKNNKEINKLLYEQAKCYLIKNIYQYVNSSELVKNNMEIAKLVMKINPKFIHYIGEEIKDKFI